MGQRGSPPYPTALRALNGETRPTRINKREPKPAAGTPTCPRTASKDVKAIWDYTLDQLATMGLATPADRDALLCYCEAVVRHRKASALIAQHGVVVMGLNGAWTTYQGVTVQRDAANEIKAFAREFGMTPSSRVGLTVPDAADGSKAARLLG
jgi:P27 family predicted phage terminase small subunit